MSRPASNADRKLIEAAKTLIIKRASIELSLREVAREARVNLGMFDYYFKGKEDFIGKVMQTFYDDFLQALTLESLDGPGPLERLQSVLRYFAAFSRQHRALLLILIRSVVAGNPNVIAFGAKNFPRHIRVIAKLLRDCQRLGLVRDIPLAVLLPFMFSTLGLPNLALAAYERMPLKKSLPLGFRKVVTEFTDFSNTELRIELLMSALAPASHERGER